MIKKLIKNKKFILATEAAANAASFYIGSGNKSLIDDVAVNAMRQVLNDIDFHGIVKVGEGEKDKAPMLAIGEILGSDLSKKPIDIAVDPVEGTTQTAKGGYEAMSTLAIAEQDCFYNPESFYLDKIACGKFTDNNLYDLIKFENSLATNLSIICKGLNKIPANTCVCILDRPRNMGLVNEIINFGCKLKLIPDCDLVAAIACCIPYSGIDVLMGVGGAPEGVLSAAALKNLSGHLKCKACDRDGKHLNNETLLIEDLVKSECAFYATGITNGTLLSGVKRTDKEIIFNSLIVEPNGTIFINKKILV